MTMWIHANVRREAVNLQEKYSNEHGWRLTDTRTGIPFERGREETRERVERYGTLVRELIWNLPGGRSDIGVQDDEKRGEVILNLPGDIADEVLQRMQTQAAINGERVWDLLYSRD